MRKELITVDDARGRQIKLLRFGDVNGRGKVDPKTELDLGDEWAGTVGMIEYIELGKAKVPVKFKVMQDRNVVGKVFQVPLDYKLKEGQEFVN